MTASTAPATNRRQLLLSSGVGAFLGAAWGTSFLSAELKSDHPTLTIYRTPELFAMLIEHRSARILMLDGDDAAKVTSITEASTGAWRQRLDIVLASDATLRSLDHSFVERWNISAMYPLPSAAQLFRSVLDGRAIRIGELTVAVESIPTGSWRTTDPVNASPWRLTVRYGSTRCIYASSWTVLSSPESSADGEVIVGITNDTGAWRRSSASVHVLAGPAESFEAPGPSGVRQLEPEVVRIYRDYPLSIELRPESIILPNQFR